ncbi:MAG: aldehyde dehydrogenase family protein [Gemmataceae bacterium]
MQLTEDLIRGVVAEVLAGMRAPRSGAIAAVAAPAAPAPTHRGWGVFGSVDDAVTAATQAQKAFEKRKLDDRRKAIDCVRRICKEQAAQLGREELEETKIGRLEHKIDKLIVCAERVPGVEFLRTDAFSGGYGLTVNEYAPFGVIGAITPVTHSLPTLAGNVINMLAAGNAIVCNPHPSAARIACKGTQLFNQAIHREIGIDSLVTIIEQPTLESAQAIFDHRGISLLCVTGGPAVARAALRSNKRAIVAGPGNPPVVVDETADLENAAVSIVVGGAYDNNLLCIGEKMVFAVEPIFAELLDAMSRHKGYRLSEKEVAALTKAAFVTGKDDGKLHVNKDLIGQDAAVLAKHAGVNVPADTLLLYGETDESHPFVDHEQMMPFVPFVRVRDVDTAIALAKKYEHGFRHTSVIHSRNVDTITRMGREMDTTLYVQNGPSVAALGVGGEGFLSFSIATPTGEGVTSPLTFTRQRRSTTVGSMRIL